MFKSKNAYEKNSWMLVVYCWLAYATVYIGRKNLSVCLADMIAEGVTDKVSGGTIGTCFMLCYAIGQFANGWLGDRFHPRHMVCTGLMCAGLMNVFMGLNSNNFLFMVIWAICGFSCSMLWSPIIRAVSTWTTAEISQAAAASLSATIPIGTILCYLICAAGLKFFNWRIAFMMCGSILCVMSVILFFCFATLKEHTTDENAKAPTHHNKTNPTSAQTTIKVFCVGLVFAAVGILFNGMLKDGLDLWIPTVLEDKFIPSSSVVSLICTILPILNIFGAYAAKGIHHRFKKDELTTCAIMFAISTVSLAIVTMFVRIIPAKTAETVIGFGDVALAVFITLLLALSSASMLGANTMLLTFIPLHFSKIGRASTVTGMLNCFSYAAAAVSSIAVGSISKNFGWEVVFIVFIGAAAAGAVICFAGHKKLRQKTDELDAYAAEE
jgi:OPA family glycerol-3-phosphate transporter-like MFS transporter